MKNFNASVYQLDKSGNETTFEYNLKGSFGGELKTSQLTDFLAKRVFKVLKAQENIKNKANKCRFFKLATSKPLYFFFSVEGQEVLHTELFESIKVKLSGLDDAGQLKAVLQGIIDVFGDIDNIKL